MEEAADIYDREVRTMYNKPNDLARESEPKPVSPQARKIPEKPNMALVPAQSEYSSQSSIVSICMDDKMLEFGRQQQPDTGRYFIIIITNLFGNKFSHM